MERVILHCDLNSFYASVEELYHPETRGKPIAVGGDADSRHGIILTKNQIAKKHGVVTGEALWQARQKCPDLIVYKPNYPRYLLFSKRVREIFNDYTDLVEPFGLDEAWLDVTASGIYGNGQQIADKLRERIFNELGVTASVGVSWNKIFAKLGSDLRKPNYTTIISKDNYKEIVWPLAASDLLYVGKSTYRQLEEMNIFTIGDIAKAPITLLKEKLGKYGEMIHIFASGQDNSSVACFNKEEIIKSIGNSITCFRDLTSKQDLDIVLYVLAESVASRLRDQGLKCRQVVISFRDNQLNCFTRQMIVEATNVSSDLMKAARKLYENNYFFQKPLRSIGLRAGKLVDAAYYKQLSLFQDEKQKDRELKLDNTIDDIRNRYGFNSIKRMSMLLDPALSNFNPKGEHVIFPESYFK